MPFGEVSAFYGTHLESLGSGHVPEKGADVLVGLRLIPLDGGGRHGLKHRGGVAVQGGDDEADLRGGGGAGFRAIGYEV